MNNKERLTLILILTALLASCNAPPSSLPQSSSSRSLSESVPPAVSEAEPVPSAPEIPAPKVLQEDKSYVFLTGFRPHNSVGSGGMGSVMAETRMPVLNIIDMIWVGANRGPGSTYDSAAEVKAIAASVDPAALDYWATKYILLPELTGATVENSNPDSNKKGSFGYWLKLSAGKIEKRGQRASLKPDEILLIE